MLLLQPRANDGVAPFKPTKNPVLSALIVLCLLVITAPAYAVQAPQFSLKDANDKTVSLKSMRGKVVYVDFWASWCIPCKQSFPWMNEIQQRYKQQGLEIVAINLDENRLDAERFLEQVKPGFTIAYDPAGETAEKYDLQVMPSSYLIDRKGNLVHMHRGFNGGAKHELEQQIQKALK